MSVIVHLSSFSGAQSLWGLLCEGFWVTALVQWSVCRQEYMAVGGLREGCGKPVWGGRIKFECTTGVNSVHMKCMFTGCVYIRTEGPFTRGWV